jgi:sodium-dependent dicarboxylate transporter 2/3/5
MAFGMPITIVTLGACWLILWLMYGRNAPATDGAAEVAIQGKAQLGALKPSERNVLIAFGLALLGWVLPDFCELILGKQHELTTVLQARLPASIPALIAMACLFAIPCEDRPAKRALTWHEAKTIDWGTILLFAAGIALGQSLFQTGLAKDLGELAVQASGARSVWAITALCTLAAIILSELASNTAAATTLVPVAIGLAESAGVSVVPPALGVAIGASFGFMLPVSTAPNAIVYSSGLVPSKEMLKAGIILDVVSFIVIVFCLWLILPIMGLA